MPDDTRRHLSDLQISIAQKRALTSSLALVTVPPGLNPNMPSEARPGLICDRPWLSASLICSIKPGFPAVKAYGGKYILSAGKPFPEIGNLLDGRM
jgi:hypothetical protein